MHSQRGEARAWGLTKEKEGREIAHSLTRKIYAEALHVFQEALDSTTQSGGCHHQLGKALPSGDGRSPGGRSGGVRDRGRW